MKMLEIDDCLLAESRKLYEKSLENSWNSIFRDLGKIYAPNRLVLLSGTTGAGKSRVSLGEALNALQLGKKVLYIHTEMSDEQVCSILYKNWNVTYNKMLTVASINTFDEFIEIYKCTKRFENYDLIIFDYLDANLFTYSSEIPMFQKLNNTIRSFDGIRKEDNFHGCFLILSQLNGRVNERNSLDALDLAGAKGVERSVDYHFSISPADDGMLNLSVRKDRYAITKQRNLSVHFNYTTLDSLPF